MAENSRSGAIFKSTGRGGCIAAFFCWIVVSNARNAPASCNCRKPGVFGELTFSTK